MVREKFVQGKVEKKILIWKYSKQSWYFWHIPTFD